MNTERLSSPRFVDLYGNKQTRKVLARVLAKAPRRTHDQAVRDRLRELAQSAETRDHTIVISFEGVDFIDSQGSEKMREILGLADTYGAEVRLARVKPNVVDLLRLDGVIDELGEQHVYGNVYEACADRIESKR